MSDNDYPEDHEPFMLEDDAWGTCPECGSGLLNWGATSDGDGNIYDVLGCPFCQESVRRANEHWYDEDGNESPAP